MKVLILQDHLRGGGTERQSIALTEAFLKEGIDAQLIVGHAGGILDDVAHNALGDRLFFGSHSTLLFTPKAILRIRKQLPKTPHALICMGRWAHLVSTVLGRTAQRTTITTVRTSRSLPYFYRRAILRSDCLITNSHWALEHARNACKGKALPPAHVIHNGLSRPDLLSIEAIDKQTARVHFQIPTDRKILISVARFDSGKGQEDLIHALALSPGLDHELWLLGAGPELERLQTLTKLLQLENRVRFLGFVEDVRQIYAAADIFVSASQLDSLPNALLEAHAAGLPIIAYPSAGIPEIVDHEKSGYLVDSFDSAGLDQQIRALVQNPAQCSSMGQFGREKIQLHFNQKQQNARFCERVLEQMKNTTERP
jgi:glycosyltransferase involved in cell wall biosynthesis